ncbi:hypothetical protein [Nostoc sp. KVJ3]|uniref:hypothetical protein n=1 Tax=Nostoc sp. KVJ3 TaxID=457945 RepID=UPI002237F71B|nr:hypothetical protein [Nostoc sp. KVJ3]
MKPDALELCHQEFKNNSVRFLLAIAIEPGYFQSFEEIVQAVSLESAIPYKDLASYQKDFLRSWDEVYEKASAEAYRRENRESPNLNWFEQMQQCHQKNELLTTGNFSGDVRERKL